MQGTNVEFKYLLFVNHTSIKLKKTSDDKWVGICQVGYLKNETQDWE